MQNSTRTIRPLERLMVCIPWALMFTPAGCGPTEKAPSRTSTTHPAEQVETVRVAGIVLKWIPTEKNLNYQRADRLIREAASRGAKIVVTTECFLDGYAIRDKEMPLDEYRALGEKIPGGDYLEQLQSLADELDIYLVAGMMERSWNETHNTAVLIGPDGKLIGKYRKHSLGHEAPRNTPGTKCPVFTTDWGRVGLMICADRREPDLVQRIAGHGVDLLICPSGGMWGPVRNDHHLQARSRENRVPIVFVHPIEFLVTGADGDILDRRFTQPAMDVTREQIGTPADEHLVAVFDVPVTRRERGRTR